MAKWKDFEIPARKVARKDKRLSGCVSLVTDRRHVTITWIALEPLYISIISSCFERYTINEAQNTHYARAVLTSTLCGN
jgi:hypothetical protein